MKPTKRAVAAAAIAAAGSLITAASADKQVSSVDHIRSAIAAMEADPALAGDARLEAMRAWLAAGGPAPKVERGVQRGAVGPDIIVGDLQDLRRIGRVFEGSEAITGFAVGTTSCNIGDTGAQWQNNTPAHPVILQNMYRLKGGRFEHVALSWVKHGFFVISGSVCDTCPNPGVSSFVLEPGCSDPYAASTNSQAFNFGPRALVNAATGVNTMAAPPSSSIPAAIRGTMRLREADADPARNVGARYFVEGQYVAADDTAAGNQLNNVSHREIVVTGSAATQTYSIALAPGAATQVMRPAIEAWKDADPSVQLETVDVPDDGRFILGSRVYDNGDGTWSYEYALYNMNSDRAARTFAVPLPGGVDVSSTGFSDVEYHSGDGVGGVDYSSVDWAAVVGGAEVSWATETAAQNANANALRFGTIYNFRFTADRPPAPTLITVGLYKPGTPASIAFPAPAPASPCTGDLTGDGLVNSADLTQLLGAWGAAPSSPADITGDGLVNSEDLTQLLGAWGACG